MSDLQRDFDALAPLAAREQYTWEAFTRIRARLSPDRERVARAIHLRYFGSPDSWDALDSHARNSWLRVADAAIAAMGETP